MRLVTDVLLFCTERMPRWNPISISGYHMREAGCTATQEVAYTLANGIAYLEAARHGGVAVEDLGRRISFFFAAHNDLLEEIAKFRAARRLWARIMKERFGMTDPRGMMLRFHAQTAGSTLTAQQPENNVVRVAVQALSAVLGGTQSLHTNSMDEALSLPTETAATVALRTQQIIAGESGVADTIDPVAGSYAIEALTTRVETGAREMIEEIDETGGAVRAIEKGMIQQRIHEAAYRHQREIESGNRTIVGVNRYGVSGSTKIPIHRLDPSLERDQIARLARLRDGRDASKVTAALSALQEAARGSDNLVPRILEAVESLATLGEIASALRSVFGKHVE